jgi:MFS family permease
MQGSLTRPSQAAGSMVGFLVVMEFCSGMAQSWYAPLLGEIGAKFGATPAELGWVTTVILLCTVVFVPTLAKLGDKYGHRKLLAVAASLLALGSIVVAIAPTFELFLIGRGMQAAVGVFLPLEFAIVRSKAGNASGKAIGLLIGALTAGASIGLLLSGYLGTLLPLEVVLWAPAIIITLCVPVVMFLVPETTVRVAGRLDWLGVALLGGGMGAFLTGLGNASSWGWSNPVVLGLMGLGVALLAGWVISALRIQHPLVDLRALRSTKSLVPVLMALPFGGQFLSSSTSVSLFARNSSDLGFGLGLTSLGAGAMLAGSAFAAMIGASFGDRIAKQTGYTVALIAGGAVATLSWLGLILFHADPVTVISWLILGGLGNGVTLAVLPTVIVLRAPHDSVGIASALYNSGRMIGGSVAGAIFTLVMSVFVMSADTGAGVRAITSETGYTAVWALCAVLTAVTTLAALKVGHTTNTTPVPPTAVPVAAAKDA